jgi:class 3 adenylate cyclase
MDVDHVLLFLEESDIILIHKTRLELMPVIRGNYSMSAFPVIGFGFTQAAIETSKLMGINDFIDYPINLHELLFRIYNLFYTLKSKKRVGLLANILPYDIIARLENGNSCIAIEHKKVTILFSDICKFTDMSSILSTSAVIGILNLLFCGFDDLCILHNVYKVETIGDGYMIAAGHDDDTFPNQVENMLHMGLAMLNFVRTHPILNQIQMRIGIHTGSAFSGVIGKTRPRYCFFGDTVNTASRMESHGIPSKIQISQSTFDEIADVREFKIQARGIIEIKGKGKMQTFIVTTDNDGSARSSRPNSLLI